MIGGERVNVEPVIEPKETLANNSLAEKLLGWKPTQNIEDWIPNYKEEMGLSDDKNNLWGYDKGGEG